MRYLRILTYVIVFFLINIPATQKFEISAKAQSEKVMFVYRVSNADGSTQIKWFDIEHPSDQYQVEVPSFGVYAISPVSSYIALATDDGDIYIIDLFTLSLTRLERKILFIDSANAPLYDEQYLLSRSLLWSPDGLDLAFVSLTRENRADIYLYNLENHQISNLTANVPVIKQYIETSSWSPDSNWLAFVGALDKMEGHPQFEAFVISRNGSQYTRLAPGWQTCRLHWSPDSLYLVSDTRCFAPIGGDSYLLVITFDINELEAIPLSPIVWPDQDVPAPHYMSPLWRNNDLIIASRFVVSDADWATEFVGFNVDGKNETPISEISPFKENPFMQGNWALWITRDDDNLSSYIHGYNLVTQDIIDNIPGSSWCLERYIQVDSRNEFIALLDGCSPNQNPFIRLFVLATDEELYRIIPSNGELVESLGFILAGVPVVQ